MVFPYNSSLWCCIFKISCKSSLLIHNIYAYTDTKYVLSVLLFRIEISCESCRKEWFTYLNRPARLDIVEKQKRLWKITFWVEFVSNAVEWTQRLIHIWKPMVYCYRMLRDIVKTFKPWIQHPSSRKQGMQFYPILP